MKKRITIAVFSDLQKHSLAYRDFDDDNIDKAVKFYRQYLERGDVNVISTRKTIVNELPEILEQK